MTDKLLIEALERCIRAISLHQGGDFKPDDHPALEEALQHGAETLARHRSQQEEAQEPAAWQGIHEPWDLWVKKPEGIDVRPLYTSPAPSESEARKPLTDVRREFEAHAFERGMDLERYPAPGDCYVNFKTDNHWQTWRAAMAASGNK